MEEFRDAWVVIAAYNEAEMIGTVVEGLLPRFGNVVVVDDGSPDNTAGEARKAGAHVVVHPINLGQGAALQTGMRYALRQNAAAVATFDADGQHRVDDLEAMVTRLTDEKLDAVLGSRFLGDTTTVPKARRLLLQVARIITWITSGVRLTDAHNGLRVFSAQAAERLRIRQNRMAHASEIIHQVGKLKLVFVEHPVTIDYTEYSKQKGQRWWSGFAILRDLFTGALLK